MMKASYISVGGRINRPQITLAKVIGFIITLTALCRCFFFSASRLLILAVLFLLLIGMVVNGFLIKIIDVLIMCLMFICLLTKADGYPYYLCAYCLIGAFGFLYMKSRPDAFKVVINTAALFSLINMVVSLLNIFAPSIYFSIINALLSPKLAADATYYYNNWNQICGLSDHYSRNAYFCVIGCLIFFSRFLATRRYRKTNAILAICELMLMVFIGKRGHLLFMVVAGIFVYLATEPKISGKWLRFLKLTVIVSVIFAILAEFVPSSFDIFRAIFTHDAGDISTGRFALWAKAFELFKNKPIWGNGYGYFNQNTMNYTIDANYAGVHNDYLQWLCEEGIVGFTINVIVLTMAFKKAYMCLKTHARKNIFSETDYAVVIWSIAFQAFVIMYSLTGLPHFDYEINIIYFISMAVPYAIGHKYGIKSKTCISIKGIR